MPKRLSPRARKPPSKLKILDPNYASPPKGSVRNALRHGGNLPFARLREGNEGYRQAVELFEGHELPPVKGTHRKIGFRPNIAANQLAEREAHISSLKRIPFFNWLLQNPRRVGIRVDGAQKNYQIMSRGIKFSFKGDTIAREIVPVLDPWGRKILFYRSSGQSSKMPGQWFPFHGMALYEEEGKTHIGFLKTEHHPKIRKQKPVPEPLSTLMKTIREMHERGEINYMEANDPYYIKAINALL